MGRLLAILLILLAGPATAQVQAAPAPALVFRTLPSAGPVWSPTGDYVMIGQDEPGYRRWMMAQPWRSAAVSGFHQYLASYGVAYVVPTWQLLRTASQWHRCGAEPFEVPPTSEWPNLVGALRYVQSYVVPAIGPVEAVSVYRNPALNACAGGAPESAHRHMFALDMVPLRPISRTAMIDTLCTAHAYQGGRFGVGLGFYSKLRFHVDTWRFRRWGERDPGVAACAPTLARLNVAPPAPTVAVAAAATPTVRGPVAVSTAPAPSAQPPLVAVPTPVPAPAKPAASVAVTSQGPATSALPPPVSAPPVVSDPLSPLN
ncbi:hypothetical protein ACFQPG_03370 [Sphingomonas sp. GCM10030256]|uniref:hypothetical protein n=1 Tax=Sphingomonas sp. GCM10030256 TaxID=3273427 RepID=UPI0036060FD2